MFAVEVYQGLSDTRIKKSHPSYWHYLLLLCSTAEQVGGKEQGSVVLGTIYIACMKTERSQSRLQPVVSREQGGETPPRDL